MQKKLPAVVLIAVFLALICLPVPLWAFLGKGSSLETEKLENRKLAEKPAFLMEKIDSYPSDWEDYFKDHLPFRSLLIESYATLTRALFDRDINGNVIFGKDGWLFYSTKKDGNCVASYRGEDLFTQTELRQIAVDLRKTRDNLKKKGIEFVLLILPNKERMYSEYMPDRFGEPAEEYAALQLVQFLQAHTDLTVVYPYEELMAAKAEYPDIPLYYKTDTHWNRIGSYIGTRAAAAAMGKELPSLSDVTVTQDPESYEGDLRRMAYLINSIPMDTAYNIEGLGLPAFTWTTDETGLLNYGVRSGSEGDVLFYKHDSFMENTMDYLYPLFGRTYGTFHQAYDQKMVDEARPDIFLLEIVERYLHRELLNGPVYGN